MPISKSKVLTDISDMLVELESIYDDITDMLVELESIYDGITEPGLTDSNREELGNQSGVIGTILGEWEQS